MTQEEVNILLCGLLHESRILQPPASAGGRPFSFVKESNLLLFPRKIMVPYFSGKL